MSRRQKYSLHEHKKRAKMTNTAMMQEGDFNGIENNLLGPTSEWVAMKMNQNWHDAQADVMAIIQTLCLLIAVAGQAMGGFGGLLVFVPAAIAWRLAENVAVHQQIIHSESYTNRNVRMNVFDF